MTFKGMKMYGFFCFFIGQFIISETLFLTWIITFEIYQFEITLIC